jgi:hypothetical protein
MMLSPGFGLSLPVLIGIGLAVVIIMGGGKR